MLGFCDPSSAMDGRQLDMERPCLPWWADPIQHQPDGDHVPSLGGLDGLPGDSLALPVQKRLNRNRGPMTGALGTASWIARLTRPEAMLLSVCSFRHQEIPFRIRNNITIIPSCVYRNANTRRTRKKFTHPPCACVGVLLHGLRSAGPDHKGRVRKACGEGVPWMPECQTTGADENAPGRSRLKPILGYRPGSRGITAAQRWRSDTA